MSAKSRSFLVSVVAALMVSFLSGTAMAEDPDPVRSMPPDAGGGSTGSTGVSETRIGVEGQRILVDGNEVRAIQQAKPSTIEITFRNYSEERITGAVARLTDTPGATVAGRDVRLGDVAPQATAVARYQITLEPAECVDYFGAAGEVSADDGDPSLFKIAFPVACPGPRLMIEQVEISGGDGDGAPEPGEVVSVLVTLHNSGADPATNVRGTMTLSNTDAEVVTGSAAWPDIAPDSSARALAPFTMRVAADAKTQQGCSGIEPGIVIDPAPPATDQPAPAPAEDQPGSTEPGAAADTPVSSEGSTKPSEETIQPDPAEPVAPDGSEPAPVPPPSPDQGVAYNALFEVTASDERFGLEFSNNFACAYAGSETGSQARDLPAEVDDRAGAAVPTGTSRSGGGPAVPVAVTSLIVVATLLARRFTFTG